MSLTEAEAVFGGVTETGVNNLLQAFFGTRPRYLNYGSPGFVPATTVAETQIGAIPFPGVPGGIDWAVRLGVPRVDLHPQTDGLPPGLSLAADRLSVATTALICVACETRREREEHDEEKQVPPGKASGTCFELELFAIGHLERTYSPDGVTIVVDAVEIVDVEPREMEAVLECLLLQILRAVLGEVELPLETLRAGAFSLTLTRGPEVENDQLEVYGNL